MSSTVTIRSSARIAERERAQALAPPPPAAPPPKKKQKPTPPAAATKPKVNANKRVRGRRGALKKIQDMPLDTVLEIFHHLEPIDLLSMSRASKELRALTQGPGSTLMWKRAYENLGDDAPPINLPGLNLMLLTSALYGPHCQVCAGKGQITVHASFIRLCWPCASENMIHYHSVSDAIAPLCSSSYIGKSRAMRYRSGYFKGEIEYHQRKIDETKHLPEKERHQVVWAAAMPERRKYIPQLVLWSSRQRYKASVAYREHLKQRRDAIVARVLATGYTEMDIRSGIMFHRLPGVHVKGQLTDKGWDKMKGKILSAVEYHKQQRLQLNMKSCFSSRIMTFRRDVDGAFATIPKPRIMAPMFTIINAEPFKAALMEYDGLATTPLADEILQRLRIPNLAERIVEITSAWRATADRLLLDLVQQAGSSSDTDDKKSVTAADTSRLELATTFFTCHWCPEALSYPRVLVHSCFVDGRKAGTAIEHSHNASDEHSKDHVKKEEDDEDPEDDVSEDEEDAADTEELCAENNYGVAKITPAEVWNDLRLSHGRGWNESGDEIGYDSEASQAARGILLAIGEDPETMTAEQVHANDIRVECLRCAKPAAAGSHRKRNRLVMTWKMAIVHDMQVHFEHPRSTEDWRLIVDEGDLAQVKKQEDSKKKTTTKIYMCSYCHSSVAERLIHQHYTNVHRGVDFDKENPLRYVFEYFDTPMKAPPLPVHLQ